MNWNSFGWGFITGILIWSIIFFVCVMKIDIPHDVAKAIKKQGYYQLNETERIYGEVKKLKWNTK